MTAAPARLSTAPGDRDRRRTPEQVQEARALRREFLYMSGQYEEHFRRSDARESPKLRDAAARVRRERSLASLIAFADCLDQLDIPAPAGEGKRHP